MKYAVLQTITTRPRYKTHLTLILLTALCAGNLFAAPSSKTSEAGKSDSSSTNYMTGKANYVSIDPALLVNIQDDNYLRYMQVGINLMTMDADAAMALQKHMAPVRHELLMLFSSRNINEVRTTEAREKLRQEALTKIQEVLAHYADIPPTKMVKSVDGKAYPSSVQEVLFTSFVIQ